MMLVAERQSARMSKTTYDGLTWSATGCFTAVPIWQQWASKAFNDMIQSPNSPGNGTQTWNSAIFSCTYSRERSPAERSVYKHSSDLWVTTQYHHLGFDSNIKYDSPGFCFTFVQEKWSHGAQKNETFFRGQSDCGILCVGNPSVAHNVCFLCHIWPSASQHLRIIRLLWKVVICKL